MPLTLDDVCYEIQQGDPPGSLETIVLFREQLPSDADSTDGDGRGPIVFLPDLHLLSSGRATGYEGGFVLNQAKRLQLAALLERLVALRDGAPEFGGLRLYQLGDFHDLWREQDHWWWFESVGDMLNRQLEDFGGLFALLGELGCERIVGNHDNKLRDAATLRSLEDHPIAQYFPPDSIVPNLISFVWGNYYRVDLFHADQLDTVECSPLAFLNPIGARMASPGGLGEMDEWHHELLPAGHPDPPAPTTRPAESVLDYTDPAVPKERKKFFSEGLAYVHNPSKIPASTFALQSIATVIGHTHAPRIVADARSSLYRLVDCGSWVNFSTNDAGDDRFWNSQIGVLVGSEIGVIQLGRQ